MSEALSMHAMTALAHFGLLTISLLTILTLFVVEASYRGLGRCESDRLSKLERNIDRVGYLTMFTGVAILIISSVTGFYTWSTDELLDNVLVRNKITISVFAIILWSGALFIRGYFGNRIWNCGSMFSLYTFISSLGYLAMLLVYDISQSLEGRYSYLAGLFEFLGIDYDAPMALSPVAMTALSLVSIGGLLIALIIAQTNGLNKASLCPKSCGEGNEPEKKEDLPRSP